MEAQYEYKMFGLGKSVSRCQYSRFLYPPTAVTSLSSIVRLILR
jgi:hypothetical protein